MSEDDPRAAIEDALRGHVADLELDLCVDRVLLAVTPAVEIVQQLRAEAEAAYTMTDSTWRECYLKGRMAMADAILAELVRRPTETPRNVE